MGLAGAGESGAVVRFERCTSLPVDCATAFDLSLSIDAHLDSFQRSGERAVGGITSGVIGLGEFVTWRARHFGVTWTMTSEISEWERPRRFVDEQRRAPFKSFHHEHVFRPLDDGTELRDRITFEAPLGPLGRIAEAVVLRRYLPHLIDVRNQFLVEEASTSPPASIQHRRSPRSPASTTMTEHRRTAAHRPVRGRRIAGPARLSLADRGLTLSATTAVGVR